MRSLVYLSPKCRDAYFLQHRAVIVKELIFSKVEKLNFTYVILFGQFLGVTDHQMTSYLAAHAAVVLSTPRNQRFMEIY